MGIMKFRYRLGSILSDYREALDNVVNEALIRLDKGLNAHSKWDTKGIPSRNSDSEKLEMLILK